LIHHETKHASTLCNLNIFDVHLAPLPASYRLIKAVVQFWERDVALFMAEGVYVGMQICVEVPIMRFA
jgi:hypothetical protein